MATRSPALIFRRAPIWYQIIGYGLFGIGAWVLWWNVRLTLIGLAGMGIAPQLALPLGWLIAGIESAVSIFVTQPENWDDIWSIIQVPTASRSVPKLTKLILSSLILGLLGTILLGVYWFDFVTTFQGLFGVGAITSDRAIIVLAYCLGTEVCSFFAFQVLRMYKIAKLEALEEAASIEPHRAYNQIMLQHRIELAKEQARAQVERERAQFAGQSGRGAGAPRVA